MFSNFFSENCAIYEMVWKNMVKPDRPQMAIYHIHFACYITNVTHTHAEYMILFAFPQQQWLCKCASLLCYTYIVVFKLTSIE